MSANRKQRRLQARTLHHIEGKGGSPSLLTMSAEAAAQTRIAKRHHQQGDLQAARDAYDCALAIDPDNADLLNHSGLLAIYEGQPEVGVGLIVRALTLHPAYMEAHHNLALALECMGRKEEAKAHYLEAIAIGPAKTDTHCNLANIFRDRGLFSEAQHHYNAALALDGKHLAALSGLADLFAKGGDVETAEKLFLTLLSVDPNQLESRINLGALYAQFGYFDKAQQQYEWALRLDPDHPAIHNNLGVVHQGMGRYAEAVRAYEQALSGGDMPSAASNRLLCMNFDPNRASETIAAEHKKWGRQVENRIGAERRHENNRAPERRLKIGYVSPDLRHHPIAFFTEGLLASHDAADFDVYCYSTALVEDEISRRLRHYSCIWRYVPALTDDRLFDVIRADGIDILVDLSGHTAKNRLTLFARKPAPIQITYLGYFNTTGLRAMDYILCGPEGIRPAEEGLYSESVYRLPNGAACYRPSADAPAVAPAVPSASQGHVTFGCMNKMSKINDRVATLWGQVMAAVPGSRLLLKSHGLEHITARTHLARLFAAAGISEDRLDMRGASPYGAYLETYGEIDIALDPFPHTGGTTTFETLWMGVPVVTLAGATMVARSSTEILSALGLGDLIAATADAYVDLAVALAGEPARLAAYRKNMRDQMKASTICRPDAFTRDLESAYRDMWRRWCAKPRPHALPWREARL